MSIWDYMKPASAEPEPVDVKLTPDGTLRLSWNDGSTGAIPVRVLRLECPCAGCVDEWTHVRTLAAESVPLDIGLREATPVGNYALALRFTDGHETGIFAWPLMRQLSAKHPAR